MARIDFTTISTWVFDLDNTLYPPQMRLFDQIEAKMNDWVMRNLALSAGEADQLRAKYWADYGTTLTGLMAHHGVEPKDYLAEVHDIDFSILSPEPALLDAIAALKGRRIVFTNADIVYAHKVLEKRGLSDLFDAVYGVETAQYHPKPERAAYEAIFSLDGLDPQSAAMFEDDPRNLLVPHEMGMRTVLVGPEPIEAAHIHHHTNDLAGFLAGLRQS